MLGVNRQLEMGLVNTYIVLYVFMCFRDAFFTRCLLYSESRSCWGFSGQCWSRLEVLNFVLP